VDFDIKALPSGAPDDFSGAVGNFQIDARAEKTTFTQTDPTEVILRVAGTGNLETLKPPTLTNEDWKIIDTSKITRGEERRAISGMVTFRQLIRPKSADHLPSAIPPYSFSFFNPNTASYQTRTSPAIPVTIIPSIAPTSAADPANPPEEIGTAPEEMRNIIGFIERPKFKNSKLKIQNSKLWHLIPIIICLLILTPLIRRKIAAAKSKDPDQHRKATALSKLSENSDSRTFYRRAGRFIEQWLTLNPELETVIKERDALCFKPETDTDPPVARERKDEIISLLKRCSKLTLLLLLTVFITPSALGENASELAQAAWKSGDYQTAITEYRSAYPHPAETPADILFNIGNCHHRLDQPGAAALAWRQALAVEPTHKQARQNLRFVEIETRAMVPEYQEWQQYLVHVSPRYYQLTFYIALWIIGIIILIMIVRRPRGTALTISIILLVITPVIATLGKVGAHNYPDDHRFATIQKQASPPPLQ